MKIRDLDEFRRLFRVPIPVHEHAAYYIETLAQSPESAGLPGLCERFAAFEANFSVLRSDDDEGAR